MLLKTIWDIKNVFETKKRKIEKRKKKGCKQNNTSCGHQGCYPFQKLYLTQGVHIHVGQLCIFHSQFTIMC
jgi:hypothetical protein